MEHVESSVGNVAPGHGHCGHWLAVGLLTIPTLQDNQIRCDHSLDTDRSEEHKLYNF